MRFKDPGSEIKQLFRAPHQVRDSRQVSSNETCQLSGSRVDHWLLYTLQQWNCLKSVLRILSFQQFITDPNWPVTTGTMLLQVRSNHPYMAQVVLVAPLLSLAIQIDCWFRQIGHYDALDQLDLSRLLSKRMPYYSYSLVHNRNSSMRSPIVDRAQLLLELADSEMSD